MKNNDLALDNFRWPLSLMVNYALANHFVCLVNQIKECKIQNVAEMKACEVLLYLVECPKEKEEIVVDYAFMTWIKNPKIQTHYLDTKEFQEIAEQYLKAQGEIDEKTHRC